MKQNKTNKKNPLGINLIKEVKYFYHENTMKKENEDTRR